MAYDLVNTLWVYLEVLMRAHSHFSVNIYAYKPGRSETIVGET